jgi:hypothetical protein
VSLYGPNYPESNYPNWYFDGQTYPIQVPISALVTVVLDDDQSSAASAFAVILVNPATVAIAVPGGAVGIEDEGIFAAPPTVDEDGLTVTIVTNW